jgi:GNAT superfamily N-acetyltransferase
MLEFTLEKFPVHKVLCDESPCSIRPPEATDEVSFCDFHKVIPDQEQLFIRNQIRDGSLFRKWTADPSFEENLPLLAFVDGKLCAMGLLRQRPGGWKRHIGRVSFLTHPDYHGLGLIEALLEEIVEVARDCGLLRIESELNGERESAVKAMGAVGFDELIRLPGYVQDMTSDFHDYVLMGMELIPSFENLGAGD